MTASVFFRRAFVVINALVTVVGRQRVTLIAGTHVASVRVRAELAADARVLGTFVNVFASEIVRLQPQTQRATAEGTPKDVDAVMRATECSFFALIDVLTGVAVGGSSAVPLVADAVFHRGAGFSKGVAVRRALFALLGFVLLVRARGAILTVGIDAVRNPSRAAGAAVTSDGVDAFLLAVVQVPLGALVYIIARCSVLGQTIPSWACAVEAAGSVDTQFRAVGDTVSAFVDILTVNTAE